jgi:hypothetical protein
MKIWKWNCWRKVPLEMLCLVVEWNQTHQTLYQKNLLRKPSTLTNQLINQTGTYGPVMLRSWRKSNQKNLLWTSIYLKTFQDIKLKWRIQIVRCSYQTQKTNQINRYQDLSEEQLWNKKLSQVKCDYSYDFRKIWGWSIYYLKTFIKTP